jgi:HEAT repeat protein
MPPPADDAPIINRLVGIVHALPPSAWRDEQRENLRTVVARGARTLRDFSAMLTDESLDVSARLTLSWLLSQLGDKRAAPTLIGQLAATDARHGGLRLALGFLGSKRATNPLLKALREDPDVSVRDAGYSLGALRDARAVPSLIAAVSDANEASSVRGTAAKQLGWLGSQTAVEPLIHALDDPPAEVRFWAAHGLGWLGDPSAVPALTKLAADDSGMLQEFGTVADEAREALAKISRSVDTHDLG